MQLVATMTRTQVLLVHGLWRTPICMLGLGRRLRGEGHAARQFAYLTIAESYDRIVTRLAGQLSRMAADGPYAVVGYSLGGVLLRAALDRVDGPQPVHFVMMGTPNRAPLLARRLAVFAPFKWAVGESGSKLAQDEFFRALPVPRCPYTLIAGTRGPVGRLSPFLASANDGIVAVEETRVRDDDLVVEVPVTHAFLPNASAVQVIVADRIAHALGGERAARAAPPSRGPATRPGA